METLGPYRIVRELSRKPYGTIYLARKDDDPSDFLIKVFNPLGSAEDEIVDDPAVASFLETAAIQKNITLAKARNWAPILDLGTCPEGGYYVSRFYSSSAKRLVDGHFHFQTNTLKPLTQGILNGLKEIGKIAKRPHAAIYLTSILIDLHRIASPDGAVLGEPAPDDVAQQSGVVGDLSSVGKVLYQLITNKAHSKTSTLWPIQISGEWNSLGAAKGQWLDLVNWLLDPEAKEQTHTLEAFEEKLKRIKQKRSKAPLLIIGAAAMVAIAGAGGIGLWYFSLRSEWRQFTKLTQEPSNAQVANFYANYSTREDFRAGLSKAPLAGLPEIQALRATLERVMAKNAAFDLRAYQGDGRVTADTAPLDVLRSDRWKGAQADLDAIKQTMEGWKVPQELIDVSWQLADWPDLRQAVEQSAKEAGLKRDKPDPQAMVRAIDWKNAMGGFEWAATLRKARAARQTLEPLKDPLLDQYAAVADSLQGSGAKVKTPEELRSFKDRLMQTAELAAKLEESVKSPEIRKRIFLTDLKATEFYQSATAAILASADPVEARMAALKAWPAKVLAIQMEDQPDVSPFRQRLTLAKKEAELAKEFSGEDDVAIMNRRIESATQSIERLESPNLTADERNTLSQQVERSLNSLNDLIQENQKAGETRRALLQSIGDEFARSISPIEKQITRVREFDATKAKGVSDQLEELRKKQEAFAVEYRRRRESDIQADSAELIKSLKDLQTTATNIQPPEPPVEKLRYVASPTLAEPVRLALAKKWDEWEISVVGQKVDKVPKSVNAKLEPLVAEFKKLDAEAGKFAIGQFSAKGETAIEAAKNLSALSAERAVGQILSAVKAPGSAEAVNTASLAALAKAQDSWNAEAGTWLKTWDEIEAALNSGKGSAEKQQTDTPSNLRKNADEIAKTTGIPDPWIKPLADRMDQLAVVEAMKASPESIDGLLGAMGTGKPELVMAGSKTLAMIVVPKDSIENIGIAREAVEKAPENLRSTLGQRMDQCASASLKAIYSSGADFDFIGSAAAVRELKKKAGLSVSTTADDLASMQKELDDVGLWGLPALRANLAIKLARSAEVGDNKTAIAAIKGMADALPKDYLTSITDPDFQDLMKKLLEQKKIVDDSEAPAIAEGGPEKSGLFKATDSGDPDALLFTATYDNKPRQLAFRRLKGVEGKPVFLCVTETPLWAMAMLVKNKSVNMNDLGGADENDESARAWHTSAGTLALRAGWLPDFDENGKAFSPFPPSLMAAGKPRQLNEAQAPGANVSWDQPAHFVSPAGAMKAAAALNCRLPKMTEWRLAAEKQDDIPNLRDKAWNDFTVYLRGISEARRNSITPNVPTSEELGAPTQPQSAVEKPGQGAPWSKSQLAGAVGKTGLSATPPFVEKVPDGTVADGYVFLRPAIAKEKYPFADLIGNVWELASEADAKADSLKMVGGSALSPISAGVGEMSPWSWRDAGLGASAGYADLGFRLAFEGKEEGPKPQVAPAVKELLSKAKYVGK